MPSLGNSEPVTVILSREPFVDLVDLYIDRPNDGSPPCETLDAEECREKLRSMGANQDSIDKALDDVWNFYKGGIRIKNPTVTGIHKRGMPQV